MTRLSDAYKCDQCGNVFIDKTLPLKLALAAANARVAELEISDAFRKATETELDLTVFQRNQHKQRAEQAEADCADFQATIKHLQEENTKRFNDGQAMYERMRQAEAQCATFETAMLKMIEDVRQGLGAGGHSTGMFIEVETGSAMLDAFIDRMAEYEFKAGTALLDENRRMRESLLKWENQFAVSEQQALKGGAE